MSSVKCSACLVVFDSNGHLKQHRQREHQMSVTVKFPGGRKEVIERDCTSRCFTCPECKGQFRWPKALRHHVAKGKCKDTTDRKTKKKPVLRSIDNDVTPAVLNSLGFVFNTEIGALICTACGFCVGREAKQLRSHMTRNHFGSYKMPSTQQLDKVLMDLKLSSNSEMWTRVSRDGGVTPVSHLPVLKGEMCSACEYLCCSKEVMRRHLIKNHIAAQSFDVSVQTLLPGANRRFFRVLEPAGSACSTEMNESLRHELSSFDALLARQNRNDGSDYLISPLLRQLNWHKKLKKNANITCEEMMGLCKLNKDSRLDDNVLAVVSKLFHRGMGLLDKVPYLTRRHIRAGRMDVSDCSKGFRFVEDASGNYRRHLANLIRMVGKSLEVQTDRRHVWNFPTHKSVEDAVLRLEAECKSTTFYPDSEQAQTKLRSVLKALFVTECCQTQTRDNLELYAVYRYVVCSSIAGGEFDRLKLLKTSTITSTCAAMIFWARLFTLVTTESAGPPLNDSSLYYIRDGVPTSFNAILEVLKLGKYMSGPAEGQHPIVHWVDDDMNSLVCKTTTVTKYGLQEMAASLVAHIKKNLGQRVLRGFDTEHLRSKLESARFVDDINAKEAGQWFMTRRENCQSVGPTDLVKFLASPSCKGSLWQDVKSSWNLNNVRKWLLQCDEFMDTMVVLIHFTFGQPARASELASLRLRDSNLEFRSVFSIRNRFSLIQVYHKSQNITGKFKPIARFAPRILHMEIIMYFYLVRPVQAFLFQKVFPNSESVAEAYLDYVFVKAGKRMTADQLRRSIAKGFSTFSDMKLDVSTYRHVATAFIDPYIRDQRLNEDLLDEQAGHSHFTASTAYARGSNDPSTLTRDQLKRFWDASSKWQAFLGLLPVGGKVRHENDIPDEVSISKSTDKMSIMAARVEVSERIAIKSIINHKNKMTMACGQPTQQQSPASIVLARTVARKYMNDPDASFTSAEQGRAVSLLLVQPKKHRLIILRTGGGKSLLYMAHFVNCPQSTDTTVVVVPTVALLNESVVKANLRGIRSCKYTGDLKRSGRCPQLVFASVEHVGQEDFRSYLTLLNARGKLHGIFIDEAHLVVTARVYRPQMIFVAMLTSVGAPITLLSATVPLFMEQELENLFGVKFQTIRSSTNRENITYVVRKVKNVKAAVIDVMERYHGLFKESKNRCIAYCATRKEVESLCSSFLSMNISVSGFHAGMEPQEQSKSVAEWKTGKSIWIAATNAFGVGIDYPSVRLVLHVGSAWSLLDYAQESGRAGRDGNSCEAVTLTSSAYQSHLSKHINEHARNDFAEMVQFLNSRDLCRRQYLQGVLDGHSFPCIADRTCQLCDVCAESNRHQSPLVKFTRDDHEISNLARFSSERIARDRAVYYELDEFLSLLPDNSCPVCWVYDRSTSPSHKCNCLARACFKCLGNDHIASTCPNKLAHYPGSCFFCGLPMLDLTNAGMSLHGTFDSKDCSHPAKDFLIAAVWAHFRNGPPNREVTNPVEFAKWLPRAADNSVFSNLIVLFYKLVQAHGPVVSSFGGPIPRLQKRIKRENL